MKVFIIFENFNCLQFEPHFDINKNIPNRQHIQKKKLKPMKKKSNTLPSYTKLKYKTKGPIDCFI